MKKSRVFTIVLAVALALSFFVACSNEIEENAGISTVSFAPSASKALNQSGVKTDLAKTVEDYHWKYYCSTTKPEELKADNLTQYEESWKDFKDMTSPEATGLGVIPNLNKGESYYFGLRGYTTATSTTETDLVWEGFHYNNEMTSSEKVKLTSNRQLITVIVNAEGKGYLYFNIFAPIVQNMGINHTSGTDTPDPKLDKFNYTWQSLDGKTSGSDWFTAQTFNDISQEFEFADDPQTGGRPMDVGDYFFTIQEYTWDDSVNDYVKLTERKQVMIVNIVSGVDTVIGGKLDSTSPLSSFEYDARGYTETDQKGMLVRFHKGDASSVTPFDVTATYLSTGKEVYVYQNSNIKVQVGKSVVIKWTTDTQVTVSVNGYELQNAVDDGPQSYSLTTDPKATKPEDKKTSIAGWSTATDKEFYAYGSKDKAYIVTITTKDKLDPQSRVKAESVSFTIVGTTADVTTVVTTSTNLTTLKNANSKIVAEVPTSATTATDLKLSVTEGERTKEALSFEISLSSGDTKLENLNDYVTITMDIDKGLEFTSVLHDSNEMTKVNSFDSWTSASDTDNAGYYSYDKDTGKLVLKVKSFSPFSFTYNTLPFTVGMYDFAFLQDAVDEAQKTSNKIVLNRDVVITTTTNAYRDITIDLNTYTLTSDNCRAIWQKEGTLTLEGTGTIKTSGTNILADSSVIRVGNGGEKAGLVLGEKVTVSSDRCYGITYFGTNKQEIVINGTVEVTGSNPALSGNGSPENGIARVTVNGTVKSSNTNAIYNPQDGLLTINGTVEGFGGIELKAGTAKVEIGSSATIKANGTPSHVEEGNNNGCSTNGYAIAVVENTGYKGGAKVFIAGGTITGKVAIVNDNAVPTENKGYISITGGTFSESPSTGYVADGYKVSDSSPYVVSAE